MDNATITMSKKDFDRLESRAKETERKLKELTKDLPEIVLVHSMYRATYMLSSMFQETTRSDVLTVPDALRKAEEANAKLVKDLEEQKETELKQREKILDLESKIRYLENRSMFDKIFN